MASPNDLYIRFLVTLGLDLDRIRDQLHSLHLPLPPSKTINTQIDYVESAVPVGILSQMESGRYSVDFMRWMRELGVSAFWAGEPHFAVDNPKAATDKKLTIDINEDPPLRVAINALLVKGIPPPDMLALLNSKFSLLIKERHISLYKSYFFDPARMTRKDWRALLESSEDYEKHIYFTALTEDIDSLKTELELPSQVSSSETLQYLLSKSFRKAKKYLSADTPESGAEARAWIDQVVKLVDKYEKYRTTDSTDFAKSLQMEFEFVDNVFATPDPETLDGLSEQIKQRELGAKDNEKDARK